MTRRVRLPLYYSGLETFALVREKDGPAKTCRLSRSYEIEVPVTIPARSFTWLLVGEPRAARKSQNTQRSPTEALRPGLSVPEP